MNPRDPRLSASVNPQTYNVVTQIATELGLSRSVVVRHLLEIGVAEFGHRFQHGNAIALEKLPSADRKLFTERAKHMRKTL